MLRWRRHTLVPLALLASVLALPTVLSAREYKFKTRHYLIETTVDQDFAEEMGELMEILHAGYSEWFSGSPRVKGLSRIVIYGTRSEYTSLGHGTPNSGGYFSSSEDMICSWLRGHENYLRTRVLAHEGFHQFFNKYVGRSAPWINEGLAELFAYSLIDGTDIKFGLVTEQDVENVRKVVGEHEGLPLKDLLTMSHEAWSSNLSTDLKLGTIQYVESRFLVHFLYYAYDGKYRKDLGRYVKAIGSGKDGIAAWGSVFGRDVEKQEQEFRKWLMQDLKPECPRCCSADLFHLIQLAYVFRKAGVEFGTLDELKEKVKATKDLKWTVIPITMTPDKLYGPGDVDEVLTWFEPPAEVDGKKKKTKAVSYELVDDPEPQEKGAPMIVCYGLHKKLALCGMMRTPPESRSKQVLPHVKNVQTKALKKLLKDAEKEAKRKERKRKK